MLHLSTDALCFIAEEFLKTIHRHAQEPFHKYTEPQTTSQEYGWLNEQLVSEE